MQKNHTDCDSELKFIQLASFSPSHSMLVWCCKKQTFGSSSAGFFPVRCPLRHPSNDVTWTTGKQ